MHASAFFKIFPPPAFLLMRHAGLDISDDAITCVAYKKGGSAISLSASQALPAGLIEGGDMKDEAAFKDLLSAFDRNHNLSYVKVSLPEEKVYLFQTDVPSKDPRIAGQNIEFKLEENVPLSAQDAVFYFDFLPAEMTQGALRASVSVVPRSYLEHLIALLRSTGMHPVAFETAPKALARAVVRAGSRKTHLVVHIMHRKTGIYVVSGGVVCFTSTIPQGSQSENSADAYTTALAREVGRTHVYWNSHGGPTSPIGRIILCGAAAVSLEAQLREKLEGQTPVSVGEIWQNQFNLDKYVPSLSREASLDYAVAAGLAMEA